MTPSELLNEILKEFNLMQSSKRKNIALFGERSTRLIQQAKNEWEKNSYGQGWIDGVKSIKNSKLNQNDINDPMSYTNQNDTNL